MRDFMLHAHDLKMLDGKYAFMSFGFIYEALSGKNTWQGNDGRDATALKAFEGEYCIATPQGKNYVLQHQMTKTQECQQHKAYHMTTH